VPSRSFFAGGIAVALAGWVSLAAQAKPPQSTLSDLETKARQDSNDAGALYELGLRYWDLKRLDDAEREFKQAVAVDPRYAPAYFALSFLPYDRRPKLWKEERKGKIPAEWQPVVQQADQMRHKAFIIDPLVDFRVIGAEPPPQDMVVIPEYGAFTTFYLLWLGLGAFGAARYQLSYSALQHFVEREFKNEPQDSIPDELFFYRGIAAAHLGLWQDATGDVQVLLDRSLKREHTDSLIQIPLNTNDFRYILALLKDRAGRPADAMSLYKEALASDLGLYMAHVRLADLYEQYQMWTDAVTERRRAVDANPDDASLVRDLGASLARANQGAEAETVLHQAMDENPRDPGAPYVLGLIEQQLNKPADARAALTRFLALAPSTDTRITDAKSRLAKLP
jgi:tetratricopeptide (TPR) repeat protein